MIIPQWPAPSNVKALATEREFLCSNSLPSSLVGISLSPYNSLNLGDHVGDKPSHVDSNRQQLLKVAAGCDEIRWLQQVHGIKCEDASIIPDGYVSDASFSQKQGLACAVMTADCLPILFCDLQGRQVAAAHAGWKGLAQGILGSTLNSFLTNNIPLNQVIAWMGPAISQAEFEVGPDVKSAFLSFDDGENWADKACFIQGRDDRWQADLYRLARLQLEYLGLAGIYGGNFCTFSDINASEKRFFSYRRQTITGRQASLIWLQPS